MLSDKTYGFFTKPVLAEMPTVEGSIRISHDITCPHCNKTMYDDLDSDWWDRNVTDQMPNEESYKDKPFIVNGFVY